MDESVNNGKNYVADDVHGKPFMWFSIGFAIFCVLSVAAVTLMYKELSGYHDRHQAEVPTRVSTGPVTPSGPQLQADPVADMKAMDKAQSELLATYGWVDKEKGVARIPIDKAMELTLEQSLVKAQAPATSTMPSAAQESSPAK